MSTTNQQKYESFNPLRKIFLRPFQRRFVNVLRSLQPKNLLEVGAGEGYLLSIIQRALPDVPLRGLDVDSTIVNEGRRLFPKLDLRPGDIYRLPEADQSWEVVVASEVLEHLERPAKALAELKRVARRYIVLSVPWEPWFRLLNFARGKHLRRWGNHPEHLNTWSRSAFVSLVTGQLRVERVVAAFPWTIVVART